MALRIEEEKAQWPSEGHWACEDSAATESGKNHVFQISRNIFIPRVE